MMKSCVAANVVRIYSVNKYFIYNVFLNGNKPGNWPAYET